MVEGRDFTSQDHEQRLGTVIIANNVKRSFWPRQSAIGKRIRAGGDRWATVVGVVGDVRGGGLDQEPRAVMYYPMLDSVGGAVGPLQMVVRSEAGMEDLVPRIRSAVQEIDANLPLNSVRTLDDLVARSISRTTFTLYLVTMGGGALLFLLMGVLASLIPANRATRTSVVDVLNTE